MSIQLMRGCRAKCVDRWMSCRTVPSSHFTRSFSQSINQPTYRSNTQLHQSAHHAADVTTSDSKSQIPAKSAATQKPFVDRLIKKPVWNEQMTIIFMKRFHFLLKNRDVGSLLQTFHELKRKGGLSAHVLKEIMKSNYICKLPVASEQTREFISELFDACYAQEDVIPGCFELEIFAGLFDFVDDVQRMQRLAEMITARRLVRVYYLDTCSIVLHALASRNIVDSVFQSTLVAYLSSAQNHGVSNLLMLQHQGAVASMLIREQIDETVEYLRSHAASLQLPNVAWNSAINALFSAKRYSDGFSLFQHWLSVLPSVDKPEHINLRVLPNANTYSSVIGIPGSPVTCEFAMEQLDQYQAQLTPLLYTVLMKAAVSQGNYYAALMWWSDMYKRGIFVMSHTVELLIIIIKHYELESDNKDEVDELVQLVWDRCNVVSSNDFGKITELYANIFMSSFLRQNDLSRTLQLVDVILKYPGYKKWACGVKLARSIKSVLQSHNHVLSDDYALFEKWLMITGN